MRRLAVLGAVQMGGGVAQVAVTAGLTVALVDASPAALGRARDAMFASLSRLRDAKCRLE